MVVYPVVFHKERAPTSVAYAENQSMFLDSLVGDAAWRAKYATDRSGAPLPWAVHKAGLEATHPYEVFQLRAMLAVPYFEKALYELPEDQVAAATAVGPKEAAADASQEADCPVMVAVATEAETRRDRSIRP